MADKRDGGMAFVKNGGVAAVVWPTQAEPVLLPPWDGRTRSRSSGADVLERIRPGGTGRGAGPGGERGGSGEMWITESVFLPPCIVALRSGCIEQAKVCSASAGGAAQLTLSPGLPRKGRRKKKSPAMRGFPGVACGGMRASAPALLS